MNDMNDGIMNFLLGNQTDELDLKNQQHFSKIINDYGRDHKQYDLYVILLWFSYMEINQDICRSAVFILSIMEKYEVYSIALRLAEKILKINGDGVVIRTMFRICRKTSDYTFAENYLENNREIIERNEFNIQYELVYFFEKMHDEAALKKTLLKIRSSSQRSIPISRTLYNFYIQFEMFEEAKNIQTHILKLKDDELNNKKAKLGEDTAEESELAIWTKLKDLVTEQEHNRQLIALRDLIKGFSHELGQPITNIRYAIQLHQMKIEYKQELYDDIPNLLNSIIRQTERVDQLLNRFSPIVTSKSERQEFNIYTKISQVFEDLSHRLAVENIRYEINGERDIIIYGDSIQFDQVFYNLIINSIYAIRLKGCAGKLDVVLKKNQKEAIILFSDNGIGIPSHNHSKIFDPFFSTKDKTKDEGGEGIGLFIVWNILKMFNGNIVSDREYNEGARFMITINLDERA